MKAFVTESSGFRDTLTATLGLNLERGYFFCLNHRMCASNSCPSALSLWATALRRKGDASSHQKGTCMAIEKKDQFVLNHIDSLVKEEERLYGRSELTGDDRRRLSELKVELDQYWDLLRQRRALREFGNDPDKAKVRAANIVENYEQ